MPKPAHFALTIARAVKRNTSFALPTDVDEDSVLLPCLPTPVEDAADPITRHVGQVRGFLLVIIIMLQSCFNHAVARYDFYSHTTSCQGAS